MLLLKRNFKQTTNEPVYQKELELSYKWSLQDLNNKLNVKEERIISLGLANNELKNSISELQTKIYQLEKDILAKDGQIRIISIDWKEANIKAESAQSLHEKSQAELEKLQDEIKVVLELKNTHGEAITKLESVIDRRNEEIHKLNKELNLTKNEYRILNSKLNTIQKERDHFAKLLDTTQQHENEFSYQESSSGSVSNDELNDSIFENKKKEEEDSSESNSQKSIVNQRK